MLHLHPIPLALFSISALFGLWLRSWRRSHFEPEEKSVKTLLGASLGLFGVLLVFTFSMANSHFEERRQLEIAEAGDLQTLWLRTSFLTDSTRNAERSLLRRYLPVRIQFFNTGPDGSGYEETLNERATAQNRMWHEANVEAAVQQRSRDNAVYGGTQ